MSAREREASTSARRGGGDTGAETRRGLSLPLRAGSGGEVTAISSVVWGARGGPARPPPSWSSPAVGRVESEARAKEKGGEREDRCGPAPSLSPSFVCSVAPALSVCGEARTGRRAQLPMSTGASCSSSRRTPTRARAKCERRGAGKGHRNGVSSRPLSLSLSLLFSAARETKNAPMAAAAADVPSYLRSGRSVLEHARLGARGRRIGFGWWGKSAKTASSAVRPKLALSLSGNEKAPFGRGRASWSRPTKMNEGPLFLEKGRA